MGTYAENIETQEIVSQKFDYYREVIFAALSPRVVLRWAHSGFYCNH
jgi:hypothetical protein